MFTSIPIGRVLGVPIKVHFLFIVFAILLLMTPWSFAGTEFDLYGKALFLAILWGSVLFHELGHALVARHFGIQALDITFWPLGGMARFKNFPEDPRAELWISIGGPAVNFLIVLMFWPLVGEGPSWPKVTFGINFLLGAFNLIPAFPMDGGRILRAALAFKRSHLQATAIAVSISRWLAFGLVVGAAIWTDAFFIMLIIGAFIWLSGTQELWAVRLRAAAEAAGFGGGPAEPEVQPPQTKKDQTLEDLENFKGSMDEFFERDQEK